jgi:cytochrome c553
MKKINIVIVIIGMAIATGAIISSGCAATAAIADKSGNQLWSENCLRCHNTPSPSAFSDRQWEVAGMHMQIRANLTLDETAKVVEFMKSAN